MKCTAFKTLERNTLQGFATLQLESGLIIADCTLHEKNGKRWVSPPSKPMIDRERKLVVDDTGKIKYVPIVDFVDGKVRGRWSDAAVAAIEAFRAADGKTPAVGAGAMNGGDSGMRLEGGAHELYRQ